MGMRAPELLDRLHVVTDFISEEPVLNEWLARKALKNQITGASRTFVVCKPNTRRVVGYYALATGSVVHAQLSAKQKRNMPDPLPVIILARLAVDCAFTGQKIGSGLLKDAILRAERIAQEVGVVALVVHALSTEAIAFYEHYRFVPLKDAPMTLIRPLAQR